ncbi:sugar ABC transporter substrate-binding protein [Paenibacillus sp. MWE-103]|uniref:Sugar ABC transporter substrate-binding protein n=1 Tax=Paenibacillus artemisiicola TaxID=1172618 RepID=A0ABS3WAJ8_9BACL|nr:sugar ABC transporter substrate-binding protein [Paenibacillus artemisiicola]MBO7745335.1 sugar ABC transporter substrate-binding protein [Paenibacillus artemisiicola]
MRKRAGLTLAVALAAGVLAGCSGGSNGAGDSNGTNGANDAGGSNAADAGSGNKPSGKTTTIDFWQLDGTGTQDFYVTLIKQFEQAHPDIKVKMANIPEDGFFEKLNAAFAAGKGPDMWGGWYSPDEFERGYIAPLDEFIARDDYDMNKYFQPATALRLKGTDGHYYGLPRDMSNAVIYYNKDLFDKYGVPYPTPDWTLDDFRDAAKKITHADEGIYGTDLFASDFNAITGNPIIWNMGSDVASDDGKKVKGFVDSPQMIKLFQYAQTLSKEGVSAPSSVMQTAGDQGPFSAGKIGMSLGFLWGYNDIKKASFKAGAVGFPKEEGSTGNFAWTEEVSWYMNNKSEKKDATWAFMKYLSSPEVGKQAIDTRFMWGPPMPSVWEEKGLEQDELLKVFLEQAKLPTKAPSYDRNRTWNEVASMFSQAYTDVVNPVDGKSYKDPAEVLPKTADEMQAKIDELLAGQ